MQVYLAPILALSIIGLSWAGSYDGLYVSNGTHILYSANPSSDSTIVVHHEPEGRIIGLAFYEPDDYLFWSEITGAGRGIWRGTLTGSTLSNVKHIVDTDIIEINGLAVDWVSRHIYWTDARKGSIELADFDGSNRRILAITGLINPRGIYADPINGFLYWNDQGSRKIERSWLDGSNREELVTGKLPNEMAVSGNNLYYVDAQDSVLYSVPISGTPTATQVITIDAPEFAIFGLAINSGIAYVSSWNGKIYSVSVPGGSNKLNPLSNLGSGQVFSTVYVAQQPAGSNPCNNANKNGCSHLCLPKGPSQSRCACPSYGGLVLQADTKNCAAPDNFLFFALADEGQVGFINVDNANDKDRYLVGRCLRPVAVAYDPVEQFVYWSDVHEHSIHKAKVDGSDHSIFMGFNHSIGVVDGLAVDYVDRRLYYSNMGQVTLGGVAYTWHKIEMADLGNPNRRRTVVETADRPRAIYLDNQNRYVYYTDWGDNAAVIRTEMDGTNPTQIKSGLDNPNGLTIQNGKVVVVDSHYKSRASEYPGKSRPAAIYTSNLVGENWSSYTTGINILTPFSVTSSGSKIYVSDWDRNAVLAFSSGSSVEETVMADVSSPMGLLYSSKTQSASAKCTQGCDGGLCVGRSTSANPQVVCTCASYDAEVYTPSNQCNVPQNFLLFADYNTIKMVGMDGQDQSVYTVVQGNRYFSNFVGLVYKEDTQTIYFSEENRRGIYYSKLDGSSSGTFYEVDHVIDGLALNPEGTRIYWTDYLGGKIASQTIPAGNNSHIEFVTGLSKPRDIAVTANHIYWTEWGTSPGVGRAERNGANAKKLVTEVDGVPLKYPNALFVDTSQNKLYIGDRNDNRIMECNLEGTDCKVLKYATDKFNHIYDIIVDNGMIIYSDWVDETVSMVSMTTDQVIELAADVMRPTQMYLKYTGPPVCPGNHGCGDKCIAYPGGYRCACNAGRVPVKNQPKQCESAYQDWIPADSSQCAADCVNQKVCAQHVGTTTYSCSCTAGYELISGSCSPCAAGRFKSGAGDDQCQVCPSGASTPGSGSTGCVCNSGFVWDVQSETCLSGSSKTGQCPTLSAPYGIALTKCEEACSSDSDCKGSQKCCGYSVNSTCNNVKACVDPVGLSECSYDGKLYLIGQSFQPNKCTNCKCEYERYLGDPRYGNAICEVQTCPVIPCSPKDQKLSPGACCPECTTNSTGIQIMNCPRDAVIITLPEDTNFYAFSYPLYVLDHGNAERDITVEPSGSKLLLWSKDKHKIVYTARAQNPPDTATCTVQVSIVDNHPPSLKCPGEQKVYTTSATGRVTWDPPMFSDYGSGVAMGYPQSNQEYGSQLAVGRHTIQYLIKDRAGNENTCTFIVTVVKEALSTCPVPDVKSGYLDCTEFTATQEKKCTLRCVSGHVPSTSDTSYTCQSDAWTPSLFENFVHSACIVEKEKVVFGRLVLSGVDCPLDLQQTERLITDHIMARYLYAVDNPFELKVLATGCQGDEDMGVDVQLSASARNAAESSALYPKMNDILDNIKRDIDNGLFRTMLPGDPTLSTTNPTTRCAPGSEIHGEKCAVCSVGTYHDEDSNQCTLCASGSYQDEEGQLTCKSCAESGHVECSCDAADDTPSQTGLSNPDQCSAVSIKCSSCSGLPLWVIIVIVVVVIVVLIVVVVVVVLVVRRRQNGGKPVTTNGTNGTNGSSHHNKAYSEEANEYDEIPHNGKGSNGDSENHYEAGESDNHYEAPDMGYDDVKGQDHGYQAIKA